MSNPKFLCTVVSVFQAGECVDVCTNITAPDPGYQAGDVLELRKPDGAIIQAKSSLVHYSLDPQIALANPDYDPPLTFNFKEINKSDIPVGTEVWMLVQHPQAVIKKHRKFEKIEKAVVELPVIEERSRKNANPNTR